MEGTFDATSEAMEMLEQDISQKPFYKERCRSNLKSNEPSLSDDWDQFIENAQNTKLSSNKINNNYTWLQDGEYVIISTPNNTNLQIEDFEVDDERIQSPVISGEWSSSISECSIVFNKDYIDISFLIDSEPNILIKGGDADPQSAYILAMVSKANGRNDFYQYWLNSSVRRGFLPSYKEKAINGELSNNEEEEMYWYAKSVIEYHDIEAAQKLANYLKTTTNENRDVELSEYILTLAQNSSNNETTEKLLEERRKREQQREAEESARRQKEKEERIQREAMERKRLEEEERLRREEEERLRREEEERLRREEEERLRREEEERLRREEERKIEEERVRREKEEQIKREKENERLRKEEEERLRKELEERQRKEEERLREEEAARIKAENEERLRKEEEERLRKEEEERLKKEEEERLKKEEEERLKKEEEERLRKEEEERLRKEEEEERRLQEIEQAIDSCSDPPSPRESPSPRSGGVLQHLVDEWDRLTSDEERPPSPGSLRVRGGDELQFSDEVENDEELRKKVRRISLARALEEEDEGESTGSPRASSKRQRSPTGRHPLQPHLFLEGPLWDRPDSRHSLASSGRHEPLIPFETFARRKEGDQRRRVSDDLLARRNERRRSVEKLRQDVSNDKKEANMVVTAKERETKQPVLKPKKAEENPKPNTNIEEFQKPKSEEITKPKVEKVTKSKVEEVTKPKSEEVTKPKAEEITKPKAEEITKPKVEESSNEKMKELQKPNVEEKLHKENRVEEEKEESEELPKVEVVEEEPSSGVEPEKQKPKPKSPRSPVESKAQKVVTKRTAVRKEPIMPDGIGAAKTAKVATAVKPKTSLSSNTKKSSATKPMAKPVAKTSTKVKHSEEESAAEPAPKAKPSPKPKTAVPNKTTAKTATKKVEEVKTRSAVVKTPEKKQVKNVSASGSASSITMHSTPSTPSSVKSTKVTTKSAKAELQKTSANSDEKLRTKNQNSSKATAPVKPKASTGKPTSSKTNTARRVPLKPKL